MTSDDGYATMNDFLTAAGLFERGTPELALSWIFPFELDEQLVHQRVHLLVAVGAVRTGLATNGRPAGDGEGKPDDGPGPEEELQVLATALTDAGACVDAGRIQDLIATHCFATTGVDYLLTDMAVELLRRFVVCTGIGR